jgi:hypothetical protein
VPVGDFESERRLFVGRLRAVFAAGTFADAFVFIAPLVGSNPNLQVAGLKSGGAAWVVRHGAVVLDDEGRIRADVRGLLLTSTGTTGPVTQVAAAVICLNTTGATVAGISQSVNLSSAGNARIRDKVTLPSPCFAPVVLIQAAGINNAPVTGGPWIAVTGTAKSANDNDLQDNDANDDNGHDGSGHDNNDH